MFFVNALLHFWAKPIPPIKCTMKIQNRGNFHKYSICGCQIKNFPIFGNPFSTHEMALLGVFLGLSSTILGLPSTFDEIFTRDSTLADKNTVWIIFPKFEFLRKWVRSRTLTPSCTPFPPEYGQNQGKSKQSVKKCSHQAIQICQSQDSFFSCLNEK